MPYVKFNQEERLRARQVIDLLAEGGEVPGLVSLVNDPKHKGVFFLSEKPYLGALKKEGIDFEIIPKNQISAPYVEFLRQKYPDQTDL